MNLPTGLAALTLASALVLTGCAEGTDSASPSTEASGNATSAAPTSGTAAEGVTVEITLEDGKFDPQGKTVKVPVGEPVTIDVTADAEGELHVHSDPETSIAFGVGNTTETLTFDKPGTIEVESHDTGVVVVQLQAS